MPARSPPSRIECEVDSEDQIEEAITAGADIIMLDNFSDATLPTVRATIGERAIVEVSGGVTLARIPVIAAIPGACIGSGVDNGGACGIRYACLDAIILIT